MPKLKVELKKEHFNKLGKSFFNVLHEERKSAWKHMGATGIGLVGLVTGFVGMSVSPALGLTVIGISSIGTGFSIKNCTGHLGEMDTVGSEMRKHINPPKSTKKEKEHRAKILTPAGLDELRHSGINLDESFYIVPKGTNLFGEKVVHVVQKQPRFSRLIRFLKRKKPPEYEDERVPGPKGSWIEYEKE